MIQNCFVMAFSLSLSLIHSHTHNLLFSLSCVTLLCLNTYHLLMSRKFFSVNFFSFLKSIINQSLVEAKYTPTIRSNQICMAQGDLMVFGGYESRCRTQLSIVCFSAQIFDEKVFTNFWRSQAVVVAQVAD